ncbi:hypothetical protein HUX88_21915 [Duganella sp. BJB1802]|uniref:hypothetical protein n=1 Tax=Duganella sp. BJB1802 TaxID=2744575 RepID=UPI001593966C|nr:hypothetical protein [Duganella sp. BJB1802]NVD73177.1 hypothetical protein [Duganella sp. BJB1802]
MTSTVTSLHTATVAAAAAAKTLTLSAPQGVPALDFAMMRDFFDAAPAGAFISFEPGAVYPVYGGAFRAKQGQTIDMRGAVLQRSSEMVTTTTASLGDGATSVTVSSVTGLQAGMAINIIGPKVGDSAVILQACLQTDTNQALRIAAIDVPSRTLTFEGPVFGTYGVDLSVGGVIAGGATLATKGPLIDACALVQGAGITIVNARVDGGRANNQTNNRWESTVDLRVKSSGGYFDNFTINNSCGEGVVTNGVSPVFNNFKFSNVNGNLIHFNGWSNGTKLSQIDGDGFNLDYQVGHANGGIIASNNTFNTIVDGFDLRNGRLSGIGSFDQSDNAYAKICNGFISGCWGGGLALFGSTSGAPAGLDVRNVRISNCGTSYVGVDVTTPDSVERALQIDLDLVLINSMIAIGGLADSRVRIRSIHADTARLTPVNAAAGRASNYAGRINGTPINAGPNLKLGVDVSSQVELSVCQNTTFDIEQSDGAGAPLAGTYGIATVYAIDAGGPWLNCTLNLSSQGGASGVMLTGVLRNCRGLLQSNDIKTAVGVNLFLRSNPNKNGAFPAAAALGVSATAISATGSGGSVTRTQYPLGFVGGAPTVPARGSFIVENGVLVSIRIDRPGAYASAPTLDFSAAAGLSGAAASAVVGPTQDYSVSDFNDFTVYVHHSCQPSGTSLLRLRQDATNSAGSGWSTVRGAVHADAAAGGAGITDAGTPLHHIHLKDLESRGPGSNWTELSLSAAVAPNVCRMTDVRSSRSSYTVPANWAFAPWASATSAVQSMVP